jgi:ribosomal protein L22
MADEKNDTPQVDEAVTEIEQPEAAAAEATEVEQPEAAAEATEVEQPEAAAEATEVEQPEGAAEATEEKPKPARAKKADAPAEKAKPSRAKRREAGERALVRAQAKYVRTSARKARLVCDHIRGKSVSEARAILAHAPRAVARDWSKLLESAVANAENNHELIGDELRIASVSADEGPTLKRFRPRAMGRATKIRKRTSHLTITLTPKE